MSSSHFLILLVTLICRCKEPSSCHDSQVHNLKEHFSGTGMNVKRNNYSVMIKKNIQNIFFKVYSSPWHLVTIIYLQGPCSVLLCNSMKVESHYILSCLPIFPPVFISKAQLSCQTAPEWINSKKEHSRGYFRTFSMYQIEI